MNLDNLVFLDTETTGLTLEHDIWEIAYAIGTGPIESAFVPHSLKNAELAALRINGYWERFDHEGVDRTAEVYIADALKDKTIVGANPSFDAYRLERRWGKAPWHYRLVDVEAMAVAVFDLDKPLGLNGVIAKLREYGYTLPENDHTAAGDVAVTRQVYIDLRDLAAQPR